MCVKLKDGGGWIAEDSPLLHPTFFGGGAYSKTRRRAEGE